MLSTVDNDTVGCCGEELGPSSVNQLCFEAGYPQGRCLASLNARMVPVWLWKGTVCKFGITELQHNFSQVGHPVKQHSFISRASGCSEPFSDVFLISSRMEIP